MLTFSSGWLKRSAPLVLLVGSAAIAAPNDKGPPSSAEVPFAKQTNVSPEEALSKSKEYVSQMQDTLRRVVALQESARKRKDIIQLNCINDKLLQVKGHLAVNDQAIANLNEMIAKGDNDGRQHEFTRVSILYQKVAVLGTEAENCVGSDLSYVGGQRVEVDIDPSIPRESTTDQPPSTVDVGRPPPASTP